MTYIRKTYLRKRWTIALVVLAASLMLLLPATAAARVHVGIGVGLWGPVYPYGYWGPYPYHYPYYGPYYGGYYGGYGYPGYGRPMGEVKIKSPEPDAEIYINGSLAGRAHDLKKFYLRQGTYDIEQRIDGDVQKERIYVLAGRTLKIEFEAAGGYASRPEAGEYRDHDRHEAEERREHERHEAEEQRERERHEREEHDDRGY